LVESADAKPSDQESQLYKNPENFYREKLLPSQCMAKEAKKFKHMTKTRKELIYLIHM
jgi:hypothetical protein